MAGIVEIVRSDGEVGRDDAVRVFHLVLPLIDAGPGREDEDAVDAAVRVIRRMPQELVLTAVLDWWVAVSTRARSPLQAAYHLPAEIAGDLRVAMESLVRLGTPIPPARWVAAQADLDRRLSELPARQDLEYYGATKLPRERDVWAEVLDRAAPLVEALQAGRQAEPVDLDIGRVDRSMRAANIAQGSRRWRAIRSRVELLQRFLDETVAVQGEAVPWLGRAVPPVVGTVPPEVQAALAPLAETLLRPVSAGGAAERELAASATADRVAELLGEAAEATDDSGLLLLAAMAEPWMAARGAAEALEPLAAVLRRRDAARDGIGRLREAGNDADEVELALMDQDIVGAERLLRVMDQRLTEDRRAEGLRRRVENLRRQAAEVAATERLDEVPDWERRLDEIARLVEAGDSVGANSGAREIEADLARLTRDAVLARADDAVARLEQLGGPASQVEETRRQISLLRGDDRVAPDGGLVDELDDLVDRLTALRVSQLEDLRAEARRRLDEALADLANLHADELELRLHELDAAAGGLVDELDDLAPLMAALDDARGLIEDIRRRRVHRWSAAQGEDLLVGHLYSYCTRDMDFARQDVLRLYAALKTKPFVILAGLTGSGKSTLARLVAEAFGARTFDGGFRRIAVHPDWIDQSEVLGYVHPVSNRFVPGWLAEVARDCERNPDSVFVVLLDEMNLAPVEQYLAEYLSAVEEMRSGATDVRLPLYPRGTAPENTAEWPAELPLPPNLWMIGTVNVDETTRALSERVLDRANVIQLSVGISDAHHTPGGGGERPWVVPYGEWRKICTTAPSDGHHEFLVDLAGILQQMGIGIGARAHIELERFLANAAGVLDGEDALDLGVLQRFVPKIRGFKRDLVEGLEQLREEFESAGCERCARVVERWLDHRVSDDDYLDGTDARIAFFV